MKKRLCILLALTGIIATTETQAQSGFSMSKVTEQRSSPSGFYMGVQGGTPLFWGDIRSLADKTHLGLAGGIFAGYKAKWFKPEIAVDYGYGKLGPLSTQANDYFNPAGTITYVQQNTSDRKLGDVYVKTSFAQAGLRLGVSLVNLFSPYRDHKLDVDLAPSIYMQKFSPAIFDAANEQKLNMGLDGGGWNYAAGGDVGLSLKISPKASVFLRSGLLWLNNTAFDGLDNDPKWHANTMMYNRIGIAFSLGKEAQPQQVIAEPYYEPFVVVEEKDAVVTTEPAPPKEEPAPVVADDGRKALLEEMYAVSIPHIYFKRGSAIINENQFAQPLQEIKSTLNRFEFSRVHIQGWCDVTGTKTINQRLSLKRAEALAAYLKENGINAARISTEGMGVDEQNGYDQEARRAQIKLSE